MKPAFPLAAITRLRKQKETALERALSRAEGEVHEATKALQTLERSMQKHRDSRSQEVGLPLSAAHLQAVAGHWATLRRQHVEQHRTLATLKASRQQALEAFLAAKRERETVEQLESDWNATRESRAAKEEQHQLDDLSAMRSQRDKTAKSADSARQELPTSFLLHSPTEHFSAKPLE